MIVVNARFLTQKLTGVQRFAIEISLELSKIINNEIIFVTPYNIQQKDYAKQLNAQVIGSHTGHIWEQIDLPFYLNKKGKPLLINLANVAPIFYQNKISTIHDIAYLNYPQTFNKKFLYAYKFLIPKIIKSSKHIITVSEFSKQEICKAYHVNTKKISVIYNAVNKKFTYIENKTLKSEKYFLAVSSLNYRKKFSAVLQAFNQYCQLNKENKLYIIGDIKNENFKEIDIKGSINNPRIKFLGRVSDEELTLYYSNAIGFIYPSIYEGFGIPPLEAQNCNCPILISNIPSLKEVFQNSALYCNPYDIKDIVKGIILLSQNSNSNIDKGIINTKRFSWNKSAVHLTEIIQSINNK